MRQLSTTSAWHRLTHVPGWGPACARLWEFKDTYVWALPSHALSPAEETGVNSLSLCSLFLSSSVFSSAERCVWRGCFLFHAAEARPKRTLPEPWAVQRAQPQGGRVQFPQSPTFPAMFLPEGPSPLSWCTGLLAPLLSSESPFWLGNKRCFHMLSPMQKGRTGLKIHNKVSLNHITNVRYCLPQIFQKGHF